MTVVIPFTPKMKRLKALSGQFKDSSPAFVIAAEAYERACQYGCSGDIEAALWSLVEREAKTAEGVR